MGTPPRAGDFASFEYRESADDGGPEASIDLVVTGMDGAVVRMPTRHVSFATVSISPEESARAALLRSRSLPIEELASREDTGAGLRRPRLLIFTDGLGLGNGQWDLRELLADLIRHLSSCVVVSPTDGVSRPELERLGAEVLVSGQALARDVETYEGQIRQLLPFLARGKPDVVLLDTVNVWAEADAAQRAGVPTIWAIHEGLRLSDWRQQFAGAACHPYMVERFRASLAASARLIFGAPSASATFSQYAPPHCRIVISRGVDLEEMDARMQALDKGGTRRGHGIAADAVVLLSVTIQKAESPACIVEAFIDVAARHGDAVLVLVGNHSPLSSRALHHLVWASGLSNRILLFPITGDIRDWYALADVLVAAPDTEAPRQSMLEAMALSLPVLATRVDGVEDVISDETNGWLCAARDVRALAAAMDRVLALQPDSRRAIGEAARDTVRRQHPASLLGPAYAQVIKDVLSGESHGVVGDVASAGALVRRLDEALGALTAVAQGRLLVDSDLDDSAIASSNPLAEFNSSAPFVRDGIATFIAGAAQGMRPGARVVDIGAGDAPYRDFFRHVEYVTVDWEHSVHAGARASDIIASADSLPMADESVDAVVMTEVLEHISVPSAALREVARILRPGGEIVLTVPFVWILHEVPYDYFRYTPSALTMLLEEAGFDQVVVTARGDYFSTLAQLMRMTPQWITSTPTDDGLEERRHLAGKTMEDLSDVFAALAPLDTQGLLPLGFNASARRIG